MKHKYYSYFFIWWKSELAEKVKVYFWGKRELTNLWFGAKVNRRKRKGTLLAETGNSPYNIIETTAIKILLFTKKYLSWSWHFAGVRYNIGIEHTYNISHSQTAVRFVYILLRLGMILAAEAQHHDCRMCFNTNFKWRYG